MSALEKPKEPKSASHSPYQFSDDLSDIVPISQAKVDPSKPSGEVFQKN
jgi:hypothetical protein